MSETLLITITLVEIVVLIAVLAAFLLVVAKHLRAISSVLAEVTWGARAVERQLRATVSNVRQMNVALKDITTSLPVVTRKIEERNRGAGRR